MSNQPSTMDNIRSTAASATHSVAEALDTRGNQGNPKKNSNSKETQGNSSDKSFKDRLDEAAYTYAPPGEEKKQETFVEKSICFYRHIPPPKIKRADIFKLSFLLHPGYELFA
jgi:hypothetical protein